MKTNRSIQNLSIEAVEKRTMLTADLGFDTPPPESEPEAMVAGFVQHDDIAAEANVVVANRTEDNRDQETCVAAVAVFEGADEADFTRSNDREMTESDLSDVDGVFNEMGEAQEAKEKEKKDTDLNKLFCPY